jgi:hypothetical protein
MFSAANKITVSNSLLAEVASSAAFPDPTFFVYGILGALVAASLLVGYALRTTT